MAKIIAFDFDGTVCENVYPNIGSARLEVLDALKAERRNGAKLILWTCREGDRLNEALDWLNFYGLTPDLVNANDQSTVDSFGNDPRKVYADEYWDDKNKDMTQVAQPNELDNYVRTITGALHGSKNDRRPTWAADSQEGRR